MSRGSAGGASTLLCRHSSQPCTRWRSKWSGTRARGKRASCPRTPNFPSTAPAEASKFMRTSRKVMLPACRGHCMGLQVPLPRPRPRFSQKRAPAPAPAPAPGKARHIGRYVRRDISANLQRKDAFGDAPGRLTIRQRKGNPNLPRGRSQPAGTSPTAAHPPAAICSCAARRSSGKWPTPGRAGNTLKRGTPVVPIKVKWNLFHVLGKQVQSLGSRPSR